MSDSDDLKERLAALEGQGRKNASAQSRPSPVVLFGGVAVIALGGFILYTLAQPEPEQPIPTSEPAEFQPAGDSFADLSFPEPEPVSAPAQPGPNKEMLAQIANLQAELERLRSEAADTSEEEAAMAALHEQLENLRAANEEAQAEFQRQLEQRDRRLQRLQNDLELARMQSPADTGPSEEELRRQELERRRREAEEFLKSRIDSPMIAYGSSAGESVKEGGKSLLDAGTDFVRNGAGSAKLTQAKAVANPSNTVPQGTMIQAALETAVDSSVPGQVRAIVSENVYSYDGTRRLIPRGSRLIGRYQSGAEVAQKRITVAWDRIILPTDQTVEISAFGGDELGRSGVTGHVDSRFAQRFGSAALISIISAAGNIAASEVTNNAASDTASDIGGNLQDSANTAMSDYLSLGPVIHVEQGATITVMVDRDLEIF